MANNELIISKVTCILLEMVYISTKWVHRSLWVNSGMHRIHSLYYPAHFHDVSSKIFISPIY